MSTATVPKTILIGHASMSEAYFKEALAGGAITPGHFVERYNDSGTFKVRAQSTAAAYGPKLVAVEDDIIGNDIDTNYAAGAVVRFVAPQRGDIVYGLVAASAVAITQGDFLEFDAAGGLRKLSVSDVADLTGTLTGTLDGILADVSGSFDATAIATLNKNAKEIQAKINAILPAGIKFPVAIAMESVDNSAGITAARIRAELL